MKRLIMLLVFGCIGITQVLWAIPTEINYQGTLKQNGLPANDPSGSSTKVTFTLTDQTGQIPYSNSISVNTPVINGLFSAKLNFQLLTGNTWDSITPYIKVNINGQDLSPTEKVSATPYAIVASSVMAGGVTPSSLAPGYGLVPAGLIAIFAANCPNGWNVFLPLQGKYPVGSDGGPNFTLGVPVGNLTHNHSGTTGGAVRGTTQNVGTPSGAPTGMYLEDVANEPLERASPHTHAIPMDSSLPPSLPIVFCQKQ